MGRLLWEWSPRHNGRGDCCGSGPLGTMGGEIAVGVVP